MPFGGRLTRETAALCTWVVRITSKACCTYLEWTGTKSRSRMLAGGLATDRQDHTEAAPPAGCALDLDSPAVVGDDALADGQPQARPLAHRLGREERVEDPR